MLGTDMFPWAKINHGTLEGSDHSMLVLFSDGTIMEGSRLLFSMTLGGGIFQSVVISLRKPGRNKWMTHWLLK